MTELWRSGSNGARQRLTLDYSSVVFSKQLTLARISVLATMVSEIKKCAKATPQIKETFDDTSIVWSFAGNSAGLRTTRLAQLSPKQAK